MLLGLDQFQEQRQSNKNFYRLVSSTNIAALATSHATARICTNQNETTRKRRAEQRTASGSTFSTAEHSRSGRQPLAPRTVLLQETCSSQRTSLLLFIRVSKQVVVPQWKRRKDREGHWLSFLPRGHTPDRPCTLLPLCCSLELSSCELLWGQDGGKAWASARSQCFSPSSFTSCAQRISNFHKLWSGTKTILSSQLIVCSTQQQLQTENLTFWVTQAPLILSSFVCTLTDASAVIHNRFHFYPG